MESKIRYFLLILAVVLWLPVSATASFDPMSDSTVVLPAGCGVSYRWVVPPTTTEKPIPKHTLNEIKFSVDASGNPWIGIDNRKLMNPVREVAAAVSEPFQGMVHLDNGQLLLTTVRTLGFIAPSAKVEFDAAGLPLMVYQPICDLPAYYSRIYRAAGNCVYLVAEDSRSRTSAIYVLRPESASAQDLKELRGYKKIFQTGDTINAVAGDGDNTFIAIGKTVFMHTLADNKITAVPVQPAEEVRDLVYQAGLGLYYTTASGVGFLGAKRAFRFIETSHPRIALHGQSLLVLFPRNLGVMAFDNIKNLWNYDYKLETAGE